MKKGCCDIKEIDWKRGPFCHGTTDTCDMPVLRERLYLAGIGYVEYEGELFTYDDGEPEKLAKAIELIRWDRSCKKNNVIRCT